MGRKSKITEQASEEEVSTANTADAAEKVATDVVSNPEIEKLERLRNELAERIIKRRKLANAAANKKKKLEDQIEAMKDEAAERAKRQRFDDFPPETGFALDKMYLLAKRAVAAELTLADLEEFVKSKASVKKSSTPNQARSSAAVEI